MKLIGTPTSPYVRKTRVVLSEKKVDYEFVLGLPQADDHIVSNYNPLGKIPVLVLDDDSTLYDSRVITEYLDTVTPNNRLIPASGRERITVKRWEALGDGLVDATVAILHESRRPAVEINAATIDRQRGKISAALKVMSTLSRWPTSPSAALSVISPSATLKSTGAASIPTSPTSSTS